MEETVYLAQNQAEAAQKDAHEWKKRYELAMADYKKASENSSFQYSALQKKVTTFKERQAVLTTELEETRKEASEWQVKYERLLLERQRDEERLTYQLKSLQVHKINCFFKIKLPWTACVEGCSSDYSHERLSF
jgi:hypothetical protein